MRVAIATFFALALAMMMPACAQPLEKFQAGKHYFVIDPAQPTSSGNKIEVLEVFMYTCPHCYDLEPYLSKWQATKGADVSYSAFPAAWNEPVEAFARAFYAAETLGILEATHEKFFAAIHKEHVSLRTLDDIAQWYSKQGVTQEQFLSAANSFAVNTKVNRAKAMVPRWGVSGTPTVIVNGKYRFDVSSAGGHQNVADLINFLVDKERAAKKAGG